MKETSAGAIVYTIIDEELKFLVIKDFHNNYGFPKGHIEQHETILEAALREIKEEVGIDVKLIDGFNKCISYTMPNGILKEVYYLLAHYENQIPIKQLEEVQEILLLNYEDTLNFLTFDLMKDVFNDAYQFLNKLEIS